MRRGSKRDRKCHQFHNLMAFEKKIIFPNQCKHKDNDVNEHNKHNR